MFVLASIRCNYRSTRFPLTSVDNIIAVFSQLGVVVDCRKDTGEILGVHIIGLHAADLIHEASNAVATKQRVQDIKFNVHAHPTLSEVTEWLSSCRWCILLTDSM